MKFLPPPTEEAFCLASGPSLCAEDVALVRRWREAGAGRLVIVTNTTFRMAPWADALCTMDYKWWREYGKEALRDFPGRRFSVIDTSEARRHAEIVRLPQPKNAGLAALLLAHEFGAKRIGMLGYDAQFTDGKRHHHGDHPPWMGNAGFVKKWPDHFRDAQPRLAGVELVNCSRATLIDAFPRMSLEQFLGAAPARAESAAA